VSSLADVLQQFRAALQPFLPLWEVLDDLDSHTWVLEPEVLFQLLFALTYMLCYVLRTVVKMALIITAAKPHSSSHAIVCNYIHTYTIMLCDTSETLLRLCANHTVS
jgi:peptidoglycan/LPS O-acetylase OafA/YrhL